MNWTVVVYGGPMFIIMIWWFVSARKWFTGPKINIEHRMLGRDEEVLEGVGEDSSSDSRNAKSLEDAEPSVTEMKA